MQKITVDLIRLAVSAALICAVVGAAEWRGFRHSDHSTTEKNRFAPPIYMNAIPIPDLPPCAATKEAIGAPTTQEAQTERGAIVRSCASVAPAPRRHSESRRLLAFAL
jgi:hypothetical protein